MHDCLHTPLGAQIEGRDLDRYSKTARRRTGEGFRGGSAAQRSVTPSFSPPSTMKVEISIKINQQDGSQGAYPPGTAGPGVVRTGMADILLQAVGARSGSSARGHELHYRARLCIKKERKGCTKRRQTSCVGTK